MQQNDHNKTAPHMAARLGAVLRSWGERLRTEDFWRSGAAWTAIVFFLTVGLAALGWSWIAGGDGEGRTSLISRYGRWRDRSPAVELTPEAAAPVETVRRAIDGLPRELAAPEPARYYAVMIDNHPEARPSAGIAKASLVYEAPVEGGITRFMAVFPDDGSDVPRIGPVRSARAYFLDWAAEYDALYAHVGGSPEALELIRKHDVRDLNEFFAGNAFWRDRRRDAPHNTYTTAAMLAEADDARYDDREAVALSGRSYKDDTVQEDRPDTAFLRINYGSASMNVAWDYDPATNDYVRNQAGRPHKDDDGTAVRAKNVVVQFANISVIDDVGRRRVTTVGEGQALYAMDGLTFRGRWRKDSRTGETRYVDASGNDVPFNAGPTWIQVVAVGTEVTY